MAIEKELLRAINLMSQGKEEGFNSFYSHTYNFVYSRAKLVMKNEEDALDLTQETFIQAYKSIDSLDDANNVYAWLGSIVYRQGMRIFRKKKEVLVNDEGETIFEDVASQDVSGNPEDAAQQKATSEIVMGMIEELPELQKAAILAFYYDNMKIEDIARISECSANTIKSRLNYAKKFLKDKVESHEKANRYKLHSLSPVVLFLAFKSLFTTDGYSMAEASAQSVYNTSCGAVGLSAGTLTLSGAGGAGITAMGTSAAGAATTAATATAATAGTATAVGTATAATGAAQAGAALVAKAGLTLGAKIGITIASILTTGAVVTGTVLLVNHTKEEEASKNIEETVDDDSQDDSSTGSILDLLQGDDAETSETETPETDAETETDTEADAEEDLEVEPEEEYEFAYGWEKYNGEYVFYEEPGDQGIYHKLVISNVRSTSEIYKYVFMDISLSMYNGTDYVETVQQTGIGPNEYGYIEFNSTTDLGNQWYVLLDLLNDGSIELNVEVEGIYGSEDGGPTILTKAAAEKDYDPTLQVQEGIYYASEEDWIDSNSSFYLSITNVTNTDRGQSFIPRLHIVSKDGTQTHSIMPYNSGSIDYLNVNMCTFRAESVTDTYDEMCEFIVYFYVLEDGSINLFYESTRMAPNLNWNGYFPNYLLEPIHLTKQP